MTNIITFDDFLKVQIKLGEIIHVEINKKAKKPAYILKIDLGDDGIKTSSAQITGLYDEKSLLGKKVICVTNFPPKNIAGIVSEILVTGFYDNNQNVVLATIDNVSDVENGQRLL